MLGGIAAVTQRSRRRPRGDLALVMVGAALAFSIAAEAIPPTPLDYVSVRLKDGAATDGYYLGSDASALWLAPNVLDRTVGEISTIPRGEIKSFKVGRYTPESTPVEGWRPPKRVLSRGEDVTKVSALDEVLELPADIRTDAGWVYPPVIPYSSALHLIEERYRVPGNDISDPTIDSVRLDHSLLLDPGLYAGRP